MLTFRDMTLDDRDTVLPMVDAFYRSNAVDHPVPREIVERSFLAAAGNEPLLRGTLIFEEGRLAGYLYVTLCYSAEVGGTCVFIEEVYLLPEFRGRGLGRQVLEWIFTQYPDSRRFRLEVTQMNQGADICMRSAASSTCATTRWCWTGDQQAIVIYCGRKT